MVKIENATLWGINSNDQITPCATAYAYRSHSGYFGIVNSEEAFQNLSRFLFGDLRVDIWVDIDQVLLPPAIQGKSVDGVYQFELLTSPLGKRWYLSRRIAVEDSVACRTHVELTNPTSSDRKQIYLSSVFLAASARMDPTDPSLHYSLTLGVRVPDYELEHKFWPNSHVEGAYLYRRTLLVSIKQTDAQTSAVYRWLDDDSAENPLAFGTPNRENEHTALVRFDSKSQPGISGNLRFIVSRWNDWNR